MKPANWRTFGAGLFGLGFAGIGGEIGGMVGWVYGVALALAFIIYFHFPVRRGWLR